MEKYKLNNQAIVEAVVKELLKENNLPEAYRSNKIKPISF
jgi:hypothetical protein